MTANALTLPEKMAAGLIEVHHALSRHRIPYALIGGIATALRSRPRYTKDIDFVLRIPAIQLPQLLDDLLEHGFAFDSSAVLREWTQEHMTVLSYQGVRVDWLKPVLPCYARAIETAGTELLLGQDIHVATAEYLILVKLLAWRLQDQLDVQSLLAAQPGRLNLNLVREEWDALGAKDDPRLLRFEEMVKEFYDVPLGSSDPAP